MNNYLEKYIKYKTKYLDLKKEIGEGGFGEDGDSKKINYIKDIDENIRIEIEENSKITTKFYNLFKNTGKDETFDHMYLYNNWIYTLNIYHESDFVEKNEDVLKSNNYYGIERLYVKLNYIIKLLTGIYNEYIYCFQEVNGLIVDIITNKFNDEFYIIASNYNDNTFCRDNKKLHNKNLCDIYYNYSYYYISMNEKDEMKRNTLFNINPIPRYKMRTKYLLTIIKKNLLLHNILQISDTHATKRYLSIIINKNDVGQILLINIHKSADQNINDFFNDILNIIYTCISEHSTIVLSKILIVGDFNFNAKENIYNPTKFIDNIISECNKNNLILTNEKSLYKKNDGIISFTCINCQLDNTVKKTDNRSSFTSDQYQ